MSGTKERILAEALRLFSLEGYEAVSVSDIAVALGMTKAALYKHYRSKRDIFDSILRRMEERDAEQARRYELPEGTAEEMPSAYGASGLSQITAFGKAMFRYWTEDEFACRFRRMLTLEQFRDREMGALYGQYLVSGPLGYLTALFAALSRPEPEKKAASFYAPMFFLYSLWDGAEDKGAAPALLDSLLDDIRETILKEGETHGE